MSTQSLRVELRLTRVGLVIPPPTQPLRVEPRRAATRISANAPAGAPPPPSRHLHRLLRCTLFPCVPTFWESSKPTGMVRAASAAKKGADGGGPPASEETEARRRLKRQALAKGILSRQPAAPRASLNPSKLVVKHQGADLVKKGQRKNRFLFSFPGLLAPVTGGKIGELKDLGSKNPVLYLDFPQGRMKLFGTIVYPKNKYMTLQFGRAGKSVICEDSFESMVVFSDAWWIGKKEENPDEAKLEFPMELKEEPQIDPNFKGGAGASLEEINGITGHKRDNAVAFSPKAEIKDYTSSEDAEELSDKDKNDITEVTPVRQSARTAGKKFNFAEGTSDDNLNGSDSDTPDAEDEKDDTVVAAMGSTSLQGKTESSCISLSDQHGSSKMDVNVGTDSSKKPLSSSGTKKISKDSVNGSGKLVQATLSTLFEKVGEKRKTPMKKKLQKPEGVAEKEKPNNLENLKETQTKGKKIVKTTKTKQRRAKVEDDIEELSSESQEKDDSDKDWTSE